MWTEADIPGLTGRTAVVTGANTGIGFATARMLAGRGATVVLACRDIAKAQEAAARITDETDTARANSATNSAATGPNAARPHATSTTIATNPQPTTGDAATAAAGRPGAGQPHQRNRHARHRGGTGRGAPAAVRDHADGPAGDALRVHVVRLDLASLGSVRAAAAELRERFPRIDLLVNNAGVTGLRGTTSDGFEAQFGINHLGHFALTGLLLDRIAGRVVTVSSIGHRFGSGRDWGSSRNAYARSKLANLLFTFALGRRLAGSPVIAVAAHPGGASTEIFRSSASWFRGANLAIARLFGRTPAMGALPTLRAATDPDAVSGDYFGPDGLFEIRGFPTKVTAAARAHDLQAQDRLWTVSEQLTGVHF